MPGMGPNPGRGVSGSMRRLHVVEYAAELGGFVLATRKGAKSGGYFLAVDDALIEQLEHNRGGDDERMTAPEVAAPVPRTSSGSALTPREIQARLRAGYTIEEVATEAGVGTDWIERFAAPVLAEQAAAVDRAGRAVLHTPRKGPSDRPLEASVRRNLAERGVLMGEEEFQNGWAARHLVETDWLVSFRFRNRGRQLSAEWMLNVANGALTTRNRLGTDLGYIEPGRPLSVTQPPGPYPVDGAAAAPTRRARPAVAPTERASAKRPASKRTVSKRTVSERTATGDGPATPANRAAAPAKRAGGAPKPADPARRAAAAAPPPKPKVATRARKATVSKLPPGPAAPDPSPIAGPDAVAPQRPRRVAAAPREVPTSLSVPVPGPADPPPPAGAHFARRADRPLRAERPPRPAERPPRQAERAPSSRDQPAAVPDSAEPPRLPLGLDDPPETGGSRFGPPV